MLALRDAELALSQHGDAGHHRAKAGLDDVRIERGTLATP